MICKMKQSNWIEKVMWGLLLALNALFLYYWVVLAANYCMHFDDVHFLWKMREYSIFEYVREMYMTRGGNFVSYGLNGVVFTISNWIGAYRFWAIIFYALGILMTWAAFNNTSFVKNSDWKVWLGIITLYNVYVLTSIDYAVFTWMCAMEYYLFAPALCLLIKYLTKDSLNWKQWVLLIALALFISGNAVSISTVTFVVLFAYGMYMWYKEGWNIRATWAKPQVRRLIGVTALMLVCFAIVFVAPGNWMRMEEGNSGVEQPQNMVQFIKAIAVCSGMFLYMMAFYIPYILIALFIGAWAGKKHPMTVPIGRYRAIGLALFISCLYLLVSVIPLAYLSNGFELQRNYTPNSFFYILTFFVVGYLWTCDAINVKFYMSDKWLCRCINICAVFLIVVMGLNIRQDLPVARAYNKAHQDRVEYLLHLQRSGQSDTIIIDPYPSVHAPDSKYIFFKLLGKETYKPAIYYESDIDTIPNGYEYHLRKLYGIDFDFILAEPKAQE